MVMDVLEEHSGSVYMGHQMMEALGPGQIACADHLNCAVPKTTILNLNITHFSCIVSLCYQKSYEHISGNT